MAIAQVWVTNVDLERALIRRFLVGAGVVAVLAAVLQQQLLLVISRSQDERS